MARVSVYVPDAMKAEMDQIGDEINWSATAQSAFTNEIIRYNSKGEIKMENVIERLRHSKHRYEMAEVETGKECGRQWAMQHAEYIHLKRLDEAHVRGDFEGYSDEWSSVIGSVLKTEVEAHPFYDEEMKFIRNVSGDYANAWVEGALEVWSGVEGKL